MSLLFSPWDIVYLVTVTAANEALSSELQGGPDLVYQNPDFVSATSEPIFTIYASNESQRSAILSY